MIAGKLKLTGVCLKLVHLVIAASSPCRSDQAVAPLVCQHVVTHLHSLDRYRPALGLDKLPRRNALRVKG